MRRTACFLTPQADVCSKETDCKCFVISKDETGFPVNEIKFKSPVRPKSRNVALVLSIRLSTDFADNVLGQDQLFFPAKPLN